MAGHVVRIGAMSSTYKILAGKSEGKRPLGRPRWEDNIKLDLRERGFGVWIGFSWLRIETNGRLL
jgi:hypothetical protein